jgi:SAM-dependent methyltransferase
MSKFDPASISIPVCTICGSQEFTFPSTRAAIGVAPQCVRCKSLERHRAIRELYDLIPSLTKGWRAFQFAPDSSVDPKAFRSFKGSVYGRSGGVDMQNTGFPDGAFDIIISNHVLEHVPDDVKALRESLRIVMPNGVVHVCAPSPIYRWETEDWGFADPNKNYHYRIYGCDFPMQMCKRIGDLLCLGVLGRDPVTRVPDFIYFFSRRADHLKALAARFQRQMVPVCRYG